MNHGQEEKIIKHFGDNLKKLRLKKKYSQQDLADAADVSKNNIYEIENGIVDTSLTTIYKLALALEIEPAALMPNQ